MKRKTERIKFNEMPSSELVKYLIDVQHPYLKKALSTFALCRKTIIETYTAEPGSKVLADLIQKASDLISTHLERDEEVLFMQIGELSLNKPIDGLPSLLKDIKKQHHSIERLFSKLRILSHDYTAPAEASAVLRLCYAQLFNFEQDFLKHIFLEEDILFPKLLEAYKHKKSDHGKF